VLNHEAGVDLAGLHDGVLQEIAEGGNRVGNVIGGGVFGKVPQGKAPDDGTTVVVGAYLEPEAQAAGSDDILCHGLHLLSMLRWSNLTYIRVLSRDSIYK